MKKAQRIQLSNLITQGVPNARYEAQIFARVNHNNLDLGAQGVIDSWYRFRQSQIVHTILWSVLKQHHVWNYNAAHKALVKGTKYSVGTNYHILLDMIDKMPKQQYIIMTFPGSKNSYSLRPLNKHDFDNILKDVQNKAQSILNK